MANSVSIDTSLLAHALIENQQTPEAIDALRRLRRDNARVYGSAAVFVEFPSLLRKLVNQGRLRSPAADRIFAGFLAMDIEPVPITGKLLQRAWDIASLLGQGDTFDAMGYAVAEAQEGEFWTCDARFANAAGARGLPGVRLFA